MRIFQSIASIHLDEYLNAGKQIQSGLWEGPGGLTHNVNAETPLDFCKRCD